MILVIGFYALILPVVLSSFLLLHIGMFFPYNLLFTIPFGVFLGWNSCIVLYYTYLQIWLDKLKKDDVYIA